MTDENLINKQITLAPIANKRLNDIVEKRKNEGSAISNRQNIIADLINKAHELEVCCTGE